MGRVGRSGTGFRTRTGAVSELLRRVSIQYREFLCKCTRKSESIYSKCLLITATQGQGDQKFTPNITPQFLEKLSRLSPITQVLFEKISVPILSQSPSGLGYPSDEAQSSYYLGKAISMDELKEISNFLVEHSIHPENTRVRKSVSERYHTVYEILVASVETTDEARQFDLPRLGTVRLVYGDHSGQLAKVCESLEKANDYAPDLQRTIILDYLTSFRTGNVEAYRESQKNWIRDRKPAVESIFGFVEPYRDPFGVRAEFEGLVSIVNEEETEKLEVLVRESSRFVQRLPWVGSTTQNEGKGPFERSELPESTFSSIHSESSI